MDQLAECAYCGAKTNLYCSGKPVCVECDALIEAHKPPRQRAPIATPHAGASEERRSAGAEYKTQQR